ncbi:MAG: GDSL-type esterase/lipase family protein [Ruthenibacterium sp.]
MENKKRILCFGDSNTWGYCADTNARYADDERWTQQLQANLGAAYMIVEEGISGRTTVFDDPLNEGLSGIAHLTTILGSHAPLDALVIMLGTNDCKERFSASPQNIADGVDRLIRKAKTLDVWRTVPRILVVAPIVIGIGCYTSAVAGEMGDGCVEKSRVLPALMRQCAETNACSYLDCNLFVHPNQIDWMHFDLQSNATFAQAMQTALEKMFEKEE